MQNINTGVDMLREFEPAAFSAQELRWLGDNMDKPPVVVFREFDPDDPKLRGVHRARVEPVVQHMYQLEQLRQFSGIPWAGFEPIREAIVDYMEWNGIALEIRRRGGVANPSQYYWDGSGSPAQYAVSADSCEMVRTRILPDGSRKSFKVIYALSPTEALHTSLSDIMPWVRDRTTGPEAERDQLVEQIISDTVGSFTCSICSHSKEFIPQEPKTRRMAWAQMARHMSTAKKEQNRHHVLKLQTFK